MTERQKDRKPIDLRRPSGGEEGKGRVVITNFWSIVLDDHWSKKIYRSQMIVVVRCYIHLRWSCFYRKCRLGKGFRAPRKTCITLNAGNCPIIESFLKIPFLQNLYCCLLLKGETLLSVVLTSKTVFSRQRPQSLQGYWKIQTTLT